MAVIPALTFLTPQPYCYNPKLTGLTFFTMQINREKT